MQNLHVQLYSPNWLLFVRFDTIVNTADESIEDLSLSHISPWADPELGNWIRMQASTGDTSSIGWACSRYWDVAHIRAQTWARCVRAHSELVVDIHSPQDSSSGSENSEPDDLSRSTLHSHLGRSSMTFSQRGVAVKIVWIIGFDWTGEVESRVSATAAFPTKWRGIDERRSLDKVGKLFDALVAARGVYEAVRILLGVIFARDV